MANSDPVQCGEISEKPTSFPHIGRLISFPLEEGHSYDTENRTSFLNSKMVTPDVFLPHCTSCKGFTGA